MSGPASPAADLPPWLRRAYGKPLPTTCTRVVTDTAPDGTITTDSLDSPYHTAAEWFQQDMDKLDTEGRGYSAGFRQIRHIDHRGHTITTTYTEGTS